MTKTNKMVRKKEEDFRLRSANLEREIATEVQFSE